MSRHLGLALTRYADRELEVGQREQVAIHLAVCGECRHELDLLHQLKAALRCEPDRAPTDLAARLLTMTAFAPQPALVPQPPHRSAPLVRRVALSMALLAAGVGGALVVAGPPPSPATPMDPTDPGLVLEHVSTANEVPFAGIDVLPVANALPSP